MDFLPQEFNLQDEQHQHSQQKVSASPTQQRVLIEALPADCAEAGKKASEDEEASADGKKLANAQ